jgi:glycosyltransferase involved in cell wall biosynthesis
MGKKVLCVGDGGVATGFARVTESIFSNLSEDYEVVHLAINYNGDPYHAVDYDLYPARLGGDLYGFNRLGNLMDKFKPDLVFILNDPWVVPKYLEILEAYDVPVVVYFPVDAKPLDLEWVHPIVQHSIPVAYTEFGRVAFTDFVPAADIKVIPHGIDKDIFYPIPKTQARQKLENLNEDYFIFLNANRNQRRKRLDLTMKGFSIFAKDKPENVKLYMHCGIRDAGWDIIKLARRPDINIEDRLILTSLELSPQNYVSIERLNYIYNACDVGINTSMGEGFGLTNFEHAACKRAQVVTDYSAPPEIYGDTAYYTPVESWYTYPGILTDGGVVTPQGVAGTLQKVYEREKLREQKAEAIYNLVTSDRFDWKVIASAWEDLFNHVLEKDYRKWTYEHYLSRRH